MKKKKKQRPLHVFYFLDHNSTKGDDKSPTRCAAVGWLVSEDEEAYYISPWIADEDDSSHDTEIFTIIKGTVSKVEIR